MSQDDLRALGAARTDRRRFARLLAMAALAGRAGPAAAEEATSRRTFSNPPGSPRSGGATGDWLAFFWRHFTGGLPAPDLPAGHVRPEPQALADVAALGAADGVTWLGHASFLIQLGGRRILTDPYLTAFASPVPPLGPKRFAPPGMRPDRLPPIDVLLLSHNHYDHLDLASLRRLPLRGRTTVVVPLGVERYLDGLGFGAIRCLDWHERLDLGGLAVTCLPAIHFSKRTLGDRNATLWCGFALEAGGRRVYFAGDTAYGPVFDELGPRYGPFDLGLVPIGAYEPRRLMVGSHATPEEAVALGRTLGCRRLMAMHWGTIRLTDEPPFEPPARFRAAGRSAGLATEALVVPAIGETIPL